MNIKAIVLTGLVGSTLLLTGCGGGGGGSAATHPTVIDGFNMTEGTADTKLGATYIQEALTAGGFSIGPSTMYSRVNVSGVEAAHSAGWTGLGKTITVLDSDFTVNGATDCAGSHGRCVSDIARTVAPGATRNEYGLGELGNSSKNLTTMASDVITSSTYYAPSSLALNPTLDNYVTSVITDLEASDALVTMAAQHSNWTSAAVTKGGVGGRGGFTACPDVGTMTVANCNSFAVKGLDSTNVIYVGEVDSSDNIPVWSNQAGEAHKNQFLVTSSDFITANSDGGAYGNSFAAPRVAGAGALVRHKFPNLSGAQTATTILHTADDLGVAGVDAVCGHGKLNVGKALAPVGNLH
jgi:hypothetical protein